jgi:hypothetical protein
MAEDKVSTTPDSSVVTPQEKFNFLDIIASSFYEGLLTKTISDLQADSQQLMNKGSEEFKKLNLAFSHISSALELIEKKGITNIRFEFRKAMEEIVKDFTENLSPEQIDKKMELLQQKFRKLGIYSALVNAFNSIHPGQNTYVQDSFIDANKRTLAATGVGITITSLFVFGLISDAKNGFPFFNGHLGKMPNAATLFIGISVLCAIVGAAYYIHNRSKNSTKLENKDAQYESLGGRTSPSSSPTRKNSY